MIAAKLIEMADSFWAFASAIVFECGGTMKRFGDCLDPWQRADFEATMPAMRRVAGIEATATACTTMFYFERARGHSKTNDIALRVIWLLAFSRRRLSVIVAAADKDQAKLIRDAIDGHVRLNPWLGKQLDVQAYSVRNADTGSVMEILSADAASSYGITPDVVICDELTHWGKRDLFDSLFSAAAKKPTCLFMVISNAGTGQGTSWQWQVRETARLDGSWHFHSLRGPQASWISAQQLEEQKKLLPGVAYRRLWLNEWTTSAGDALNEADLTYAIDSKLEPILRSEPGWVYAGGLDLGLSRDSAALALVGKDSRTGRIRLASMKVWKPSKLKRVDLEDVETAVVATHTAFRFSAMFADPWQGEYLTQRMQKRSIPLTTYYFPPANHDRMARNLINQFSDGNVKLFDHPDLVRELRSTSVVESSPGKIKLSHPRNEHGHGDCMIAFALALLAVNEARAAPAFGRPFGLAAGHELPRHGTAKQAAGLVTAGNVQMTKERFAELTQALVGNVADKAQSVG